MACIDRFVHRLEKGLNTLIGERGVKLSGGEKQRVAIARAILKNPDIYIFDEATSSLDALNEDDIVNSIRQVSKGKTTLMIAHRFSTILSADEIIVMDGGKIVGQGTHKQLYVNCPAYKRLVGPQIRIVEELALV
jgi:ATP-binding cassette subfamily B protein